MIKDQRKLIKLKPDEAYNLLTKGEIRQELHQKIDRKDGERKSELMKIERTRHLQMWHDQSDILHHSYLSLMVSTLYNKNLFLTNEEYEQKCPDRFPIDVQATVEKPYIYILGQSKSTDLHQLYIYILYEVQN